MIPLLIFNAGMILLGAGIATRWLPASFYSSPLRALHITVGITTPPPEKLWIIALVWMAIITALVDGFVILTLLLINVLK